ncbi:regulator of (H+)-ATPase in vacuolar membrane [Rhodotorula sphaerocarpa]
MPSLVLQETAVASPNAGPHTVTSTLVGRQPLVISAAGNRINLLDEACQYQQGLPFAEAFPTAAHEATQQVEAVAVDVSSGRIAASSGRRIAVWTTGRAGTWRVHSTFVAQHSVSTIDFSQGTIIAAGEGVSLWSLDESTAFPTWSKNGTLSEFVSTTTLARLSPSAQVLATIHAAMSSIVVLSNISPRSASAQNRLSFRSRVAHAVRIRDISWRPSDAIEDSGPVLFTQTIDGIFRIWGCVIDEPDFFSLWCSLDVHATLPKHLPLATLYWRTQDMPHAAGGMRLGTADDFVTVFSDGSVHLTTVSSFDSRPPTCLVQSTQVLQEAVFDPSQLANLRYPHLLPSRSDAASSFHLIGRCSRGTLVHARARRLDAIGTSKRTFFHDPPTRPPVSLVGRVRQLAPTADGTALLVRGENGRVQSWEMGQEEVVTDMAVGEARVPEGARLATWHDGRFFAVASGSSMKIFKFRHSKRLQHLASLEVGDDASFDDLVAFFAVRASPETFSTTIVTVSARFELRSYVYNHSSRSLEEEGRKDLQAATSAAAASGTGGTQPQLVAACQVPVGPNAEVIETAALLVIDSEGTVQRWVTELADPAGGWRVEHRLRTEVRGASRIACAVDGTSAIASAGTSAPGSTRVAIWDPKASDFTSGEQYSCVIDEELVHLEWSAEDAILACTTPSRVLLYAARRQDDLAASPPWGLVAELRITGLALSAADQVFFFSPELETGQDVHRLARQMVAPLPLHHPHLLFQALLQGHFDAVSRILVGLATELTVDGNLTPVPMKAEQDRLTIDSFLRDPTRSTKRKKGASDDVFAALTTAGDDENSASQRVQLSSDDLSRLLAALRRRALRGLSKLDHEHLAVLAQTVHETQERRGSIDDHGLRYLISMRSFVLYRHNADSSGLPQKDGSSDRLPYRDIVFAYHSESQDLLLEEGVKASGGHSTWAVVRSLGAAMWLKSPEALVRLAETVGRTEFMRPGAEDRDPISAMLFYLALRKLHVVNTFWKQASGQGDQRQMLKFLANDFEQQRWKTAALKNAFALMSKQRFQFATAFFLLGESLKDAVNVCVRQLDDLQLAILLARVYEGDEGPVFRNLLEQTVLPSAFQSGQRWLATWAFWMLGRRDVAVQAVITPLPVLANRLPYKLENVQSPAREDPTLVYLFAQLRSWSLQTVKGALAVSGRTESSFVLHIARTLCRSGCHVLALNLLRTWVFPAPALNSENSSKRPGILGDRRRHSLLRSSTILDVNLPNSNLPSRAASPAPPQATETDLAEREQQRQKFREVVQTVKVEAKAPAEFSLDAFGF